MFAFRIWSDFGIFKDPLTITQTLTHDFPPKTTVGGIMASILGIDYNDYFQDEEYFNFKYSVVILNNTRKKSFVQNYINDYTTMSDSRMKSKKFKSDRKPSYRQMLINPNFLIIVDGFKYEDEIIRLLKNHYTNYALFMGNSEFPMNYEFIEIDATESDLLKLHSITTSDNIQFEMSKKYNMTRVALKAYDDRKYKDFINIVNCSDVILLKKDIIGYTINTYLGEYNCEFI